MELPSDSAATDSSSTPEDASPDIESPGSSVTDVPKDEEASPKPRLVWSNLPKTLVPHADKLAACLQEGGDPVPVIAELCTRALRQPAELLDAVGSLLAGWFDGQTTALAKGVPTEHLVAELTHGSPILTGIIVRHWREGGQAARLERLADAVGNVPNLLRGAETGRMLCRLAGAVALSKPLRAQRLIDLAKPLLAGSEHADALDDAADWKQAGEALKRLDATTREFWRARLVNADETGESEPDVPPIMLSGLKIALEEMSGVPRVFAQFLQPQADSAAEKIEPASIEAVPEDPEDASKAPEDEVEISAEPPHEESGARSTEQDTTIEAKERSVADPQTVPEITRDSESSVSETPPIAEPASDEAQPMANESGPTAAEEPAATDLAAIKGISTESAPAAKGEGEESIVTSDAVADIEKGNEDDVPPDSPPSEPQATWAFVRGADSGTVQVTSTSSTELSDDIARPAPSTVESEPEPAATAEPAATSLPGWNTTMSAPEAPSPKRASGVLLALLAGIALAVGGIMAWKQKLIAPVAAASTSMTSGQTSPTTASSSSQMTEAKKSTNPAPLALAPEANPEPVTSPTPTTPPSVSENPIIAASAKTPSPPTMPIASAAPEAVMLPGMKEPQESPPAPLTAKPAIESKILNNPSDSATVPRVLTAEDKERQQMKAELFEQNPGVARWHHRIATERYEKVRALIMGRESYLPAHAPEYAALLKVLLLDPPTDATSREVVCKQAIRRLPPQEIVPLFEKAVYRGSPNAREVKDACTLLFDLRREALGPVMSARVEALASKVIE